MNDRRPGDREQDAIEGAERLRALGIHAWAVGTAVNTESHEWEAPWRDGAGWPMPDGFPAPTLEIAVMRLARFTANHAWMTAHEMRACEAAALEEAAEAKASAERAERRLAAAKDVLAKILTAVGDAP